jgi:zinc protease
MIDRSVMPVTGNPGNIKFPAFREIELENGLKIFLIKDNRYDLITARFLFRSGSFSDFFSGKNKSGLASITSEMLNKGTGKHTAHQIAELLDMNGALTGSGAGYDASFLSLTCLPSNFDSVFGLGADMILEPSFPEAELNSKKNRLINSLISMQDDGAYLAERIFKSVVFEGTPYADDPDGNIRSVNSFGRTDLAEFKNRHFIPSNMIIAVVGNFDDEYIVNKMNESFGFGSEPVVNEDYKFNLKSNGIKVYLKEKKDATQASLYMGHRGVSRNTEDSVRMVFMNTLLGGSFTSRINRNLREEKGLTYGARTAFNFMKYSGDFSVEAEINHDKAGQAVEEIIRELNIIRTGIAEEEEIQKVKNYITGNYPMQLETSNNVAGKILSLELYGVNKNYYDNYLADVNSVSSEDIKKTAEKYLFPDELNIVAVGNVKKLKKQLSGLGEIIITEEVI